MSKICSFSLIMICLISNISFAGTLVINSMHSDPTAKKAFKAVIDNFEKEYPNEGKFTKPEILFVRPIPFLKPPKTIEPIRAITVNTPFERFGKMIAPSDDEKEEEEEELEMEVEDSKSESEEQSDVEQGKGVA